MNIMNFFFALTFLLSSAETELVDGKTVTVDSDSLFGIEKNFNFFVSAVNSTDLVISLTSYSDFSDPDMLVKAGKKPTYDDYDYASLAWGSGSIIISPSELKANSSYHILAICYTICGFSITVSYTKEINLEDGLPINGQLIKGRQNVYQFNTGNSTGDSMSISVSNIKGKVDMYVVIGLETDLTADNSEDIVHTWEGNLVYKTKKFPEDTVYRTAIMAEKNSTYTILAKADSIKSTKLQAGIPISGEVSENNFTYYYFNVLSENETISISLTMLTGGCNIYVRANELPSLKNYDFISNHTGNENLIITYNDRKKLGKLTGKYYIGIYGYTHSVYTLTLTTSNISFVPLTPGVPQSGSVNQSLINYFFIEYPINDANITISLTVASGNADLYAKNCSKDLKKCQFEQKELDNPAEIFYSQHTTGSENIEIPYKAGLCPKSKTCNFVIGVFGVLPYSTYTLLVTTNKSDEIILRDGKPMYITVENSTNKYFKFNVFSESVYEVLFMITPVSGDTDLYGSLNQVISGLNYQKGSTEAGVEIDQIKWVKGVDNESLTGTYHVLAFSSSPSSFSIVAKTSIPGRNSTIQIYPGHPQKDTVYNYTGSEYRIYMFPVHYTEETKQKLTITLTSITGKFSIYVANKISNLDWDNKLFYYNWKGSDKSHKGQYYTITILPEDPKYLIDSTYLILVKAEKFLADLSATFIINYSVGDGSIILSEDTPYNGVVASGEYEHFTFPIHIKHKNIIITLTCLAGDADLYISTSQNNTFPTNEKYQFKSSTPGDEKINLNWQENELSKACPDVSDSYTFGNNTKCNILISIYGFQTSTYSLRIHTSQESLVMLTIGQPYYGNLSSSEYGYFYSYIHANEAFKVSVQPDLGDPDLYLNIIDKSQASSNTSTWQRPNSEVYDFESISSVLTEEISINSTLLKLKCPSGVCLIISSVLCKEKPCSYYIQVNQQNETQTLIENQVTYGTTNNGFVYYTYYSNRDFDNFLIQVTPINSGNPDLYVSKGRDNLPTGESFDWSSSFWGGDSLLITKDDKFFNGESMKGTYNIGIRDIWGTCSFTVLVNNNPSPVQKLKTGVPQFGSIQKHEISYYLFKNILQEDIIISLTPTLGNGNIYVNTVNEWGEDMYTHLPGPENYLWSSNTSSNKYIVNVTSSDKNFCSYCDFIIAVKSTDSLFTYTITSRNDLQITLLQDGIPIRSKANPKHWSVYTFEVLTKTDFFVTLTCFSGSPNLYISKSEELEWDNFIGTIFFVKGTMSLKVNYDETNFHLGNYYIIVESNYDDSFFSLVAHTADNYITLVDGWPILYSLEPSKTEGVSLRLDGKNRNFLSFTLKSFSSYCPTVYIKLQSANETQRKPSSDYNTFTYSNSSCNLKTTKNGEKISYLSIRNDFSSNYSNFLFTLINDNSDQDLEFELEVSVSTEIIVVPLGETTYAIVNNKENKRYEFITSEKGELDIYVIPCIGEFKLEISSNWTLVTQDMPDIVVNRLTEGTLAGSIYNADGIYYATVSKYKDFETEGIFLLFNEFTRQGEKRKTLYKPGNNGLIKWSNHRDRDIQVSWTGLEDDNGHTVNETIVYEIYFTTLEENSMLTSCSIIYNYYYNDDKTRLIGSVVNDTKFDVTIPERKGYINVLAMLGNRTESLFNYIVYDPTEVLAENGRGAGRGSMLLFLLLAVLLVLATGTSYYYYKKKKQAENILDFEMNDVRNVASVPPNPEAEKKANPYAPFEN